MSDKNSSSDQMIWSTAASNPTGTGEKVVSSEPSESMVGEAQLKRALSYAEKKNCLDSINTLSDAALAKFGASAGNLTVLADWLKLALNQPSKHTEEFLTQFLQTLQKFSASKDILEESKLSKRLRKLSETETFSPQLRFIASNVLKSLRKSTVQLPPISVPLTVVVAASPRSVLSTSTPKRARRETKKVTWGDHGGPSPREQDAYGGWGLITTKEIPNLEELRAAAEGMTAEFAQLTATGPNSPRVLADMAHERRTLEKQRRTAQVESLKDKALLRPWRNPREVVLPDDVMAVRTPSAQPPSFASLSETIEIPVFPLKAPSHVPQKPTDSSMLISTAASEASKLKKAAEYNPEDTYDPGSVAYDPVESEYFPAKQEGELAVPPRKRVSRFAPLTSSEYPPQDQHYTAESAEPAMSIREQSVQLPQGFPAKSEVSYHQAHSQLPTAAYDPAQPYQSQQFLPPQQGFPPSRSSYDYQYPAAAADSQPFVQAYDSVQHASSQSYPQPQWHGAVYPALPDTSQHHHGQQLNHGVVSNPSRDSIAPNTAWQPPQHGMPPNSAAQHMVPSRKRVTRFAPISSQEQQNQPQATQFAYYQTEPSSTSFYDHPAASTPLVQQNQGYPNAYTSQPSQPQYPPFTQFAAPDQPPSSYYSSQQPPAPSLQHYQGAPQGFYSHHQYPHHY